MSAGYQFDQDGGQANRITSLDANGFSVGNSADANTAGATYHYIVFNEGSGAIDNGSYTGDGTTPRAITGVGFQPQYVMIRANANRRGHHRPTGTGPPALGANSYFFGAFADVNSGIQALQADGFQLGNDATVNQSGNAYHYLAFKNNP